MSTTDEAATVPTMEALAGQLRTALGKAIASGDGVSTYTEALVAVRGIIRADTTSACHNAESEARAAAHRSSVAATERASRRNRGGQ